jgi:undecaprenyl-diphosphatase
MGARTAERARTARYPLAIAVACGVAFAAIAYWANAGGTPSIDGSIESWVVDHRTSAVTSVAKVVTWLGSGAVLYPATAVIALLWWRRRDWRPGLALAVALGGATALYNIFKPVFERPRPPAQDAIGTYSHWSFPSGHATQSMAFYAMLAFLLSIGVSSRTRWWLGGALVILVVGATRIYLGAHWFTDVLGGYALGGCWAALVAAAWVVAAER